MVSNYWSSTLTRLAKMAIFTPLLGLSSLKASISSLVLYRREGELSRLLLSKYAMTLTWKQMHFTLVHYSWILLTLPPHHTLPDQ